MKATLIYDGLSDPKIPEILIPESGPDGIAAAGQFQGSPLEKLCEIAGRCCYDSFGKGRNSESYHKHILEVGHTSVLGHANITLNYSGLDYKDKYFIARLPGVYINESVICINLRTIAELDKYSELDASVKRTLRYYGNKVAPQIISPIAEYYVLRDWMDVGYDQYDEETMWISMFMCGSRGFSHEQVRHGYRTAISQRSTRYVDEDDSDWIYHPLIVQYCQEQGLELPGGTEQLAKENYSIVKNDLEPWLIARGVGKQTARKQARGAARGLLGNALYTEMVFSASVAQWKRMLKQRCTIHADAEIRIVYNSVLRELKHSRFANQFLGWNLVPSPDGIGKVLSS